MGNFVGKIDIAAFLEGLDLVFGGDFIEHFLQIFMLQKLVFDALHFAMEADDWLRT